MWASHLWLARCVSCRDTLVCTVCATMSPCRPRRADTRSAIAIQGPFRGTAVAVTLAGPDAWNSGKVPETEETELAMPLPQVVIIGGGFAGLQAITGLKHLRVQATLIDRHNYHLFQPLLYQVATGGLSAANISAPLRALMRKRKNTRVLLEAVQSIDVQRHEVVMADFRLPYDTLIVATGSEPNYFGRDAWATLAPSLKGVDDAISIRNRILFAFEQAEREKEPDRIRPWMTFVIVGGGATGVELAGALGELKRQTLKGNFRNIDPATAQVILIQIEDRILPTFPPDLSQRAADALRRLGVTVHTNARATDIQPCRLIVHMPDGKSMEIRAQTILWTAGVRGTALGQQLAQAANTQVDHHGRLIVEPDLSISGHPEILVIGDLACCLDQHRQPLPAVAPVAIQQGRYAADLIKARLEGRTLPPFRYRDHGSMATIGRGVAVVSLGRLRFDGWIGWVTWLFIHLLYVELFENRMLILIQWAWNYVTRNRSARLITREIESGPKS